MCGLWTASFFWRDWYSLSDAARAVYSAGYLAEVLKHESGDAFLIALADVLEARQTNRSTLAARAGVTRQTVYHALSKIGNPRFSTLLSLMHGLGLSFSVVPRR